MTGISSKTLNNSPTNKYKFNGIEHTEDFGLNTYDAFFRTNDPQIGRWWQLDPKGELFYGLTPYNSMGNNPIKFNDPLGDKFDEDSKKIIEALKLAVAARQKELSAQRMDLKKQIRDAKKSGDRSQVKQLKDLQKEVNFMSAEMISAHNEIGEMGKSGQLFSIKKYAAMEGTTTERFTTYVEQTKTVLMGFDGKNYSGLLHELKHGYDFLIGEMSYKSTDQSNLDFNNLDDVMGDLFQKVGAFYDVYDESRAFNRAYSYKGEQRPAVSDILQAYRDEGYRPSPTPKNSGNTTPPKSEIIFKTQKN